MPRSMWKMWAICTLQIWPLCAAADGFSLQQSVQAGRPMRALEIRLSEGETLVAELAGQRQTLRARGVHKAVIESVRVAPDASVTLMRVSADNGEWIALWGGASGKDLLIAERGDLHGDPGERRALVLSVEKTTGDLNAVSLGTRHEGLTACGDAQALLPDRRMVDAKTLKLVARPGLPVATPELPHASVVAASQATPAKLHLLSAASSTVVDPITGTPQLPHALVDGRSDSHWSMPAASLALLRWSQRALPIERFELEFVGRKAAATLTFYLEGSTFDVSLGKPSGAPDRFVITPPAPVESGCVALGNGANATLQVAEIAALTRVDADDALTQLVSDLVQDGPRAALAADLLAALGEPAAHSLAARFGELSARGQRRALKALASALTQPDVLARVLEAARSSDVPLRDAALALLVRGGEPGSQGLRTLALGADASGDAAARALAAPDRHELAALLSALNAPSGPDRPTLRRALIAVARRDAGAFDAAVEAFKTAQPRAEARAALALVAAAAERPDTGLSLAESALDVGDFPSRFRLCLAAGQLAPSAKLDTWLAQKAASAEEWMLRRAAYDALVSRNADEAARLAGTVSRDAYPRVRAAASEALAKAGQAAPLSKLARDDAWPLVRVAAVRSLAKLPNTRETLAARLDDSSRHVRAASIDALAQQKANDLWPRIEVRFVKEDEWPVVKAAAVHFASALCIQAARPSLTETARRALRPDASEDDRGVGLDALRALHDLGGEAAADARLIATREAASPELKRAFEQAGPSRCETKSAEATR
jgi:hypothetical protein